MYPKTGFDDLFPHLVDGLTALRLQFCSRICCKTALPFRQPIHGNVLALRPCCCRSVATMQVDALQAFRGDVGPRSSNPCRHWPLVVCHSTFSITCWEHRHQLLFVVWLCCVISAATMICAALSTATLSIVGLHKTPLVRSIRHNPTFRIGEIPLRRRFRFGLLGVRNLRSPPARLLPGLFLLLLPCGHLGFRLRFSAPAAFLLGFGL